jgi:hypothetical protein
LKFFVRQIYPIMTDKFVISHKFVNFLLFSDSFKLEADFTKVFGSCRNQPHFVAQAPDRINFYLSVSIDRFSIE